MPELSELLQYLVEARGSDLHLKAGSPPHVRADGRLSTTPFDTLDPTAIERIALELLPRARADELADAGEVDFAHSVPGVGRFRVNVYRQRGSVGIVLRRVIPGIPSFDQLGLPPMVERLAAETRGLIVVTGPSGSGKTTTISALLDRINETRTAHIVTIEDPIEYLHADKQSIVSQREVGTDTRDMASAMQRVLRQGPDVVFVGELRDVETMRAVLAAAETGHLVLTTMPTTTAAETVSRIIDFFPPFQQKQARHSLALALRAVVSQRLLERADGKGRTPAVEILISTSKVFDCIIDPDRAPALERIIAEGEYHGMQTFDQALFGLFKDGMVSLRDALAVAAQPEDLRIALQQAGLSSAF